MICRTVETSTLAYNAVIIESLPLCINVFARATSVEPADGQYTAASTQSHPCIGIFVLHAES